MSTSSCEDDVMRIKKKLEKMLKSNDIDVNTSIDMLNLLKKYPIDLPILKNTGIGMVLNNLRKSCNSDDLGSLAKSLLKNWKRLVDGVSPSTNNDSKDKSNNSPTTNNSSSNREVSKSPDNDKKTASNGKNGMTAGDSSSNISNTSLTAKTNGLTATATPTSVALKQEKRFNPLARSISFTPTKDPVRLKCREMLANALEITESIENGAELCDVNEIAGRCEDMIFNEFKNTDVKYKNRVRSRVINLKDAKNPKFRESVRLGIITPDQLAKMTSEEMASDDLKNLRAKFTKEAIDDHQMARTQGAKTSLLICGKCKKNNVVYSEMQTRSADEPMTTFAYCQECGHRWKFC
jgi:transcription elongation factor S-II